MVIIKLFCLEFMHKCEHMEAYQIRRGFSGLERLSLTFTTKGKNETFAVSLELCVQWS